MEQVIGVVAAPFFNGVSAHVTLVAAPLFAAVGLAFSMLIGGVAAIALALGVF